MNLCLLCIPLLVGKGVTLFFLFVSLNSVHFCFVSLCTPALVIVMGKEGVRGGTLDQKAYELALYLRRSDI